jgi:hypothetical protein
LDTAYIRICEDNQAIEDTESSFLPPGDTELQDAPYDHIYSYSIKHVKSPIKGNIKNSASRKCIGVAT